MTIDEAIRHRRSIRHFLPDPVPSNTLREILALANLAPSIGNRQMWRYIVVTDATVLSFLGGQIERRINEIADWPEFIGQEMRIRVWKEHALHFLQAPVVIFLVNQGYTHPLSRPLTEHGMEAWEADRLFGQPDIQSISGMAAYISLLAETRGYGTCWLTDPLIARKELEASLKLKPKESLLALITMGRPAEFPTPKPRVPIDELIEWR